MPLDKIDWRLYMLSYSFGILRDIAHNWRHVVIILVGFSAKYNSFLFPFVWGIPSHQSHRILHRGRMYFYRFQCFSLWGCTLVEGGITQITVWVYLDACLWASRISLRLISYPSFELLIKLYLSMLSEILSTPTKYLFIGDFGALLVGWYEMNIDDWWIEIINNRQIYELIIREDKE